MAGLALSTINVQKISALIFNKRSLLERACVFWVFFPTKLETAQIWMENKNFLPKKQRTSMIFCDVTANVTFHKLPKQCNDRKIRVTKIHADAQAVLLLGNLPILVRCT